MSDDYKVERTSRQVIERKLLTALTDDAVVAVLFTKEDLGCVIAALKEFDTRPADKIRSGLEQLRQAAFP